MMQTALEVTAGSSCSPADDEGVGSNEPELAPPLVPARLRAPFPRRPGGPPLACAEGCPGAFDAWPPLAWVAGIADDEGPPLAWVVLPVDAAGEADGTALGKAGMAAKLIGQHLFARCRVVKAKYALVVCTHGHKGFVKATMSSAEETLQAW